jgi:hypothetical protein
MEKQRVVQYGISCTYGWTAVRRSTICPIDRDPRPLQVFDTEVVVANRTFSGVCAWRAKQEIETLKGTGDSIPAPTTIVTAAERIPPDKRTGIYDKVT